MDSSLGPPARAQPRCLGLGCDSGCPGPAGGVGVGEGQHRLPAGSVTASMYSRCMFQSRPGIDESVRCNCRAHTARYTSLCCLDSIRGCSPIFQTKCSVKTGENYYPKHVTVLTDKPRFLNLLPLVCVWISLKHLPVHLLSSLSVGLCFVPGPWGEGGSLGGVCLCPSGGRGAGGIPRREVWRVGVDLLPLLLMPAVSG